jgi:hypothetical protein
VKVWTRMKALLNSVSAFAGQSIGMIPPRDLTIMRMGVTEVRIRLYWKANEQLPASLSDLPILEGRDNSTIDGWGRAVEYGIRGTTTVTLSSRGPDRMAGGTGVNEDIIVMFDVSDDQWVGHPRSGTAPKNPTGAAMSPSQGLDRL